jgi:thiamine transport system substrate-binding protein
VPFWLRLALPPKPAEPDLDYASGGIASGLSFLAAHSHAFLAFGGMMKKILLTATMLFALGTTAQAKDVLTVYTYESFVGDYGPGAKIKAKFEETCDCDVKWVSLGDGVAVLNRLKLEGSNTKADVVLGLDTNLTAEAHDLGLFGKHGVDVARAKVPGGWTDLEFLPYDYGHFAFVYNTEQVKNPPNSLEELINGDPKQKIALEDPRSSTPGLGFLLWMKTVYGGKAAEKWAVLKKRVLITAPGWNEAYALFTKGEVSMVFSYVTSPAYHMIEEKTDKYQAANFSEGHYLQVEVAGLIEASPHKALAQKFMDFILTPGFQDNIPTINWMMPASATTAPLPAEFDKLVKPAKTLLYTPQEVNAHRRDWINEWFKAVNG